MTQTLSKLTKREGKLPNLQADVQRLLGLQHLLNTNAAHHRFVLVTHPSAIATVIGFLLLLANIIARLDAHSYHGYLWHRFSLEGQRDPFLQFWHVAKVRLRFLFFLPTLNDNIGHLVAAVEIQPMAFQWDRACAREGGATLGRVAITECPPRGIGRVRVHCVMMKLCGHEARHETFAPLVELIERA